MLFNINKKEDLPEIELKIVNEIKALTIDIINTNNTGNIDFSLDLVETLYTLYSKHIKIDPNDNNYKNRDRVILSTPTAYPALLATLYMSGYDISFDNLKEVLNDRMIITGTKIKTNDFSTGLSTALGIGIAEDHLNKNFNKDLINYYTYVVISDLDLMNSKNYSTLSLVSTLKLNNIILFYDNNHEAFGENERKIFKVDSNKYFESLGFDTIDVNKYNVLEIDEAIKKAKNNEQPTIIILNQDNDKYKFENNYISNNYVLNKKETTDIKKELNVRDIPFTASNETKDAMVEMINNRMKNILSKKEEFSLELNKKNIEYTFNDDDLPEDVVIKILTNLIECNKTFIGLVSSSIEHIDKFYKKEIKNIINCGFRNDIIGDIQNGLALSGVRNFSIIDLKDAECMIDSIYDAKQLELNNIYIFINSENDFNSFNNIDSIRNIKEFNVFRPSDVNEIIGSFKIALNSDRPSGIIINNNDILTKDESSISEVEKGAYIIKKETKTADCILVSSGVDLDLTLDISTSLNEKGIDNRVISIPSTTLFDETSKNYKDKLLNNDNVFVLESIVSNYWYKYIKDNKYLINPNNIDWFNTNMDKDELKNKIIDYIDNCISII